jgi:hypothetical protein
LFINEIECSNYRLVSAEIRENVYDYIKNNPNCTKNQVVKGVKDYSRLTTLEAIDELMDEEKTGQRVKFTRDKPKGFYKLFINDKNEFKLLMDEINRTLSFARDTTHIDLVALHRKKSKNILSAKHYRNLIQLQQMAFYTKISSLATAIDQNVKSVDDRDTLDLRLALVLKISNKLNKVMLPTLRSDLEEMIEEFGKLKTSEANHTLNLIDELIRRHLIQLQ